MASNIEFEIFCILAYNKDFVPEEFIRINEKKSL